MEYQKAKSVAKRIEIKGPKLRALVLQTWKTISDIVGATLGPGGQPVLIERYEHGMPPMVTKDGVTVFRSLGFEDAGAHCIMETGRDTAVRTASEAGDGTTTATILAEALVRFLNEYVTANPRVSPQRVVRQLERTFKTDIEPTITSLSRKVNPDKPKGKALMRAVATISANGDTDLAEAVMQCFEITGDEGNVIITEQSGPSGYEIEKIDGFPIEMGYEESCAKFAPTFINDPGTQRCVLDKPVFLLYHGRLTEIQSVQLLLEQVGEAWAAGGPRNVVIVACGFSESVLANLALNFSQSDTINVFPLTVPRSPFSNGQLALLQDVAAVTGSRLLDAIQYPLERATSEDLGPGVSSFECSRFRSTILGHADESLLGIRIDEINEVIKVAESQMDADNLKMRKARLANGIAKLRVMGSSNGELKEKRDRAEDAVCAVRGAIKAGCLPGGAWTLLRVLRALPDNDVNREVLAKALMEPFYRLVANCGIVDFNEVNDILAPITKAIDADKAPVVFDFLNSKHVDPYVEGILDSTPAVLEAVRNSISIASQHGTLGGIVAFQRDHDFERSEARATAAYMRDGSVNEADERP
jgi:chaperonin GroEL